MKEPRAVCVRCRRPEAVCYCRFVTPMKTATRVVIVQHPRERDVPINTARIASLCLPDAEVHVTVRFDRDLGPGAILLYPGEDAIDVEESPPEGPVTLVVVDGTWWQARKLVRENPVLAALPRYAFRPRAPSDYKIRREPQDDYVSTIEALAHVLGVLEGDPGKGEAMLVPFRAMVEAQLGYAARGGGTRHVKKPRRAEGDPRARLPGMIRERAGDLVCVHAEANAWPFGSPERRPDEIVQLVACRVRTGETFERFVAPAGSLAPTTPRHLEVDAEAILAGGDRASFDREWAAFLRPDDLVATWGPYASMIFALPEPRADLKRAAHQLVNATLGEIDTYVTRLGLDAGAPMGHGRAGRRLAQMVALARAMA